MLTSWNAFHNHDVKSCNNKDNFKNKAKKFNVSNFCFENG